MQTGTVKTIRETGQFGFIVPDDGSADVFFHRTSLRKGLDLSPELKGRRVRFKAEPQEGKGPRATQVEPAN